MEDKKELAMKKANDIIAMIRKSAEAAFEKTGFSQEDKNAYILGWMENEFKRAIEAIFLGDTEWYRGLLDWRLSEKQKEQKPEEKLNGKMILDSYSRGYNDGYRHGLIDKNAPGTTKDNPIDPFDTKLFQDGVKEGRRLEREDMQKEPFSCGQENGSSEEPVLPGIKDRGIPGKDFIPMEWVDACEKYGKWKIVKQEQPELDIDSLRDWSMRFSPGIRQEIEATAYHFWNRALNARKEE